MSIPSVVKGQYYNVLLRTAAGPPEVFAIVCGLNTRSFAAAVVTSDTFVRDCAAPEAVPVRLVNVTGKTWDVTGSGVLNRAQLAALTATLGVSQTWRFDLGQPSTDLVYGGHWDGPGVLESFRITSEDGNFVTIDLSIKSDGIWAFTVVP